MSVDSWEIPAVVREPSAKIRARELVLTILILEKNSRKVGDALLKLFRKKF